MKFKDKRGEFKEIDKLPADPETAQTLGLSKPAGAVYLSNRVQKIIEADPENKNLTKKEIAKKVKDIMKKGESGQLGPDWFVECVAIGFAAKTLKMINES